MHGPPGPEDRHRCDGAPHARFQERASRMRLGGVDVPVVSPEDLFVAIVLAAPPCDLEDVVSVLKAQGTVLLAKYAPSRPLSPVFPAKVDPSRLWRPVLPVKVDPSQPSRSILPVKVDPSRLSRPVLPVKIAPSRLWRPVLPVKVAPARLSEAGCAAQPARTRGGGENRRTVRRTGQFRASQNC